MNGTNNKNISKRRFLKRSAVITSGFAVGLHRSAFTNMLFYDDLDKWTREALFYKNNETGFQCEKCPRYCVLANDGDIGICRNRITSKGKMYTIAYGNPCAVHIDPIEKKPFFHFLPNSKTFSIATAGCNLRCLNCQNWQISQSSPRDTDNVDLMPEQLVKACLENKCESIAYTYAEPITFYEYAYDSAKLARQSKIRNLWKSNGYINEKPLRQLCKVLDGANIDLKTFDDAIYRKLSQGKLAPVLKSLKVLREEGVWLEITNLIIPTWTDNFDTIKRMCEWLCSNGLSDAPLHFSRFTPQYKLARLPATPMTTLEKAYMIAQEAGMKYVYLGNVGGHKTENTYCPKCKKAIIERRVFTILSNNVVNGKCKFCGEKIAGVWS